MSRMKSLFLLMMCAAVLCGAAYGAAAQAGSTSLKQADIDKLIGFYEWAFEARFTPDERDRFAELSAEYSRQSPEAARKDADALIAAHAKVRVRDAAAQRQMRQAFNEGFIKDLRAAGGDVSQLLVGIYERGQSVDAAGEVLSVEEASRDAEPSMSTGGSHGDASNNLVGRWLKSGGAGGSRSPTGKTLYNSGNDVIFEFRADGTMLFLNEKNTLSITQCRITETMRMSGTYSVSGDSVTMNLGTGTHTGTSSCERAGNFKKTLSASSLTKRFVVKRLESVFRPDAPLILCLDGANDDDCFERADK
jgi:predicted nucleic acid-binding protein